MQIRKLSCTCIFLMAFLFVLSCNNGSQPKPTVPKDPEIPDLPQLESIYINKMPFRTTYEVDEKIDLSGLEVIAVYSDETEKTVDEWESNPADGTVLTEIGRKEVEITYSEKTVSFFINVNEKAPYVCDSFFWGKWVRMDNGSEYEILESKVKKDSEIYEIISSTETELNVAELGTFVKDSASVIVCDSIPYFRKGGANIEYSLKIVGFMDGASRAAATVPSGIKGKAKSEKYKSFEDESECEEDGIITFTAPTADDTQTVTIEYDDTIIVVPGLQVENNGDYMGTVALVGEDDYSLKITGTISQEQKYQGYLFGNFAKEYVMELSITNISENKCKSSVCSIEAEDPNLVITSDTNLSAFTISTLAGGSTKKLLLKLTYGTMADAYIDTGIKVSINNPLTGQKWVDYVPLRFFKGLIPVSVAAQSPEENDKAALNGFVIYPDGNNQFFSVGNRSSKTILVPSFSTDKKYMLVFSGATVTSELSDSTEMYYTVNPSSANIKSVDVCPSDPEVLVKYITHGGNNHSEDDAFYAEEPFQAYLSEGEIDYYSFTAETAELFAPGTKTLYKLTYESDYGKVPDDVFLIENTSLSKLLLPELKEEGMSFMGWYYDNERIDSNDFIITQDVKLIAKWEYTKYSIIYILDGGQAVYSNPNSYTMEDDDIYLNEPYRSGYTFAGWYFEDDFSGEPVQFIKKGSLGNVILFARWIKDDSKLHRIVYELNGGSFWTDKITYYHDGSNTIELPVPYKTGKIFKGWYLNSDFTGGQVVKITQGIAGNINLYASWGNPDEYDIVLSNGSFTNKEQFDPIIMDTIGVVTRIVDGDDKTSIYVLGKRNSVAENKNYMMIPAGKGIAERLRGEGIAINYSRNYNGEYSVLMDMSHGDGANNLHFMNESDSEDNYPAYNYVLNYPVKCDLGTNWYIPDASELSNILRWKRSGINEVLDFIGYDLIEDGTYWSSTKTNQLSINYYTSDCDNNGPGVVCFFAMNTGSSIFSLKGMSSDHEYGVLALKRIDFE